MNNQDILYKELPAEYGRYSVSNRGEIINTETQKPVAQHLTHNGYKFVKLHAPSGRITKRVSRLVAEMFVPNPLNKPQVDHINNDRTDNRAENLQWLTASENVQKSWDSGRVHYKGSRGDSGKIRAYYISNENIERLKTVVNKSQLINELLEKHFETSAEHLSTTTPSPKNSDVSDLLHPNTYEETKSKVHDWDAEKDCCQNDTKPCKHWVWDVATGEGYVNTLSGRSRDAE